MAPATQPSKNPAIEYSSSYAFYRNRRAFPLTLLLSRWEGAPYQSLLRSEDLPLPGERAGVREIPLE